MKHLILLAIFPVCCFGQALNTGLYYPPPAAGMQLGQVGETQTDIATKNYLICQAFTVPLASDGQLGVSMFTPYVYVGTADATATWGIAVYAGACTSGSTKVCSLLTTNPAAASAWNAVNVPSCPILFAGSSYSLVYLQSSTTQKIGSGANYASCSSGHGGINYGYYSSSPLGATGPFPATLPAMTANSNDICYSLYVQSPDNLIFGSSDGRNFVLSGGTGMAYAEPADIFMGFEGGTNGSNIAASSTPLTASLATSPYAGTVGNSLTWYLGSSTSAFTFSTAAQISNVPNPFRIVNALYSGGGNLGASCNASTACNSSELGIPVANGGPVTIWRSFYWTGCNPASAQCGAWGGLKLGTEYLVAHAGNTFAGCFGEGSGGNTASYVSCSAGVAYRWGLRLTPGTPDKIERILCSGGAFLGYTSGTTTYNNGVFAGWTFGPSGEQPGSGTFNTDNTVIFLHGDHFATPSCY